MTEQDADAIRTLAGRTNGAWDMVGMPMPRDPALLDPNTSRLRVRTVAGRFPFPLPNGWFVVATSAALDRGEIRPLRYFGCDLVLYRTEGGEPRLVDAYCAHLGAHLAVGGRIEGDCIRCPFHGWAYEGRTGHCTDIPYSRAERIPSRARVRPYPTIERNGAIWAWHHLDEGEPFYDLPSVPELDDPAWMSPELREFTIASSCQEMAENNHDFAHFRYVHGTDSIPETEERIEGPYKSVKSPGLERETFGLGLGVVRVPGALTFVSSVTPIDDDTVHVRWFFTVPVDSGEESLAFFADQFTAGVTQDIPIWENKVYRERPVLTKSEAGIIAHRKWCKQFYSQPEDL